MKKIILASKSPRRRDILSSIGVDFEVVTDDTPENIDTSLCPEEVVSTLAKFKGDNVSKKICNDCVIIAADTVVAVDEKILGKPADENDAEQMLLMLSGRAHQVYTGVYIKDTMSGKSVVFSEKTDVFFRKLDINEIKGYIKTNEPMDKAGSYGIQGIGSLFVEKIDGDYFNVVGLPICRLSEILKSEFDIRLNC